MNMLIKEIKTLEQIKQKRNEILKEHEIYKKNNPHSYSYPTHQMEELRKKENSIQI